jgi:hypothetical protein
MAEGGCDLLGGGLHQRTVAWSASIQGAAVQVQGVRPACGSGRPVRSSLVLLALPGSQRRPRGGLRSRAAPRLRVACSVAVEDRLDAQVTPWSCCMSPPICVVHAHAALICHLHDGHCPLRAQVAVVLGTQWGDEGKGKLVDILAQQYDIVARAQVLLFWRAACMPCPLTPYHASGPVCPLLTWRCVPLVKCHAAYIATSRVPKRQRRAEGTLGGCG